MSRTSPAALVVAGLTKRYGTFTAVDDISFAVETGDFFGFLGPNGAGKTTTINAIVGLATLSGGRIEVFGHDNVSDWRSARRLVGLAPQEFNFDRYLSIRDILIYQAGYYGLAPRTVNERADELLERFGLSAKAKQTFIKLSGGQKRRLTLARALIHEPKLLILDEPTAGVDVELRIALWEWLRELNAAGTTIILTTHYLEEAEALCRNIAIIESGRIVAAEPTERLVGQRGTATLSVTLDRPADGVVSGTRVRRDEDGRTIHFDELEAAQIAPTLGQLEAAGYGIENVEFKRASLQDVFLRLVRK